MPKATTDHIHEFYARFLKMPADRQRGVIAGLVAVSGVEPGERLRQTTRNKIIATVGHSPVWLGDIVRSCGPRGRSQHEKYRNVRLELRRLIARGLIVQVGHWTYVAGDGLRERKVG